MKKFYSIVLSTLIIFTISGCISPKSFIDPTYPKISYDDIKKKQTPLRLKLLVEFQRNGEHLEKVDSILKDNTERVLRASGIIVPNAEGGEGQIKVIVNNIADLGTAAAKGFGTGLTFGLVGTTVTDAYEMTLSITVNGKTIERTAIKHAIHTAIGNTSIPVGIETIPPNAAFERVLEQMILRVLQDMQNTGELAQYHMVSSPFAHKNSTQIVFPSFPTSSLGMQTNSIHSQAGASPRSQASLVPNVLVGNAD